MVIKSIGLKWFRGAGDSFEVETNCKSVVIYGSNGAGKSSIVDAVEYMIKGKIEHLSFEYKGNKQEKAVINTHKPDYQNAEIWVEFENGEKPAVEITGKKKDAATNAMNKWDYRHTVLRQHEVAEFIQSSKGDKYSILLPLFGLQGIETAAQNLNKLAKLTQNQSELAVKKGELKNSKDKFKQEFGDDNYEVIENKIVELHGKYCQESRTTEVIDRCQEIKRSLDDKFAKYSTKDRLYSALSEIAAIDVAEPVNAIREANVKLTASVELLVSEKLKVLQATDAFIAKLENKEEIECPSCGNSILVVEFKGHIKSEQKRLEEIDLVFKGRNKQFDRFLGQVRTIKNNLNKEEVKGWKGKFTEQSIKASIAQFESYNPENLSIDSDKDLELIEKNTLEIIKLADESSKEAPEPIKNLIDDKRKVETASEVFRVRKTHEEISKIEALIGFIEKVETEVRNEIRQSCDVIMEEISSNIDSMWKVLHPTESIDDIRLCQPDKDKAINIFLRFHGKEQDSPRLTLSEGYRNSLGLCIFLAMADRYTNDDLPLFLDDVVVSLDRDHRGMIAGLLKDRFPNRQIIILTHDRDWFAELRHQLDQKLWDFKSMLPYQSPEIGICWSQTAMGFDDARELLTIGRPDSACNDARKIMDTELSLLAEALKLRLIYQRGNKNDTRMAHDFLKRLLADGKKCLKKKNGNEFEIYTEGLDLLKEADCFLTTWGNKGSHSYDITAAEATKFIEACEKALNIFECTNCSKKIGFADVSKKEYLQCQCGDLKWDYGKN